MRDPFLTDRAYRYSYPLDAERMQKGAQFFVGKHDFNAVRSVGTPVKSTVRTIFWCEVDQNNDGLIRIRVCGDGFLYNMVRIIAGTLMEVGTGKRETGAIARAIETGDRLALGQTAPAQGLTLRRVLYLGEEEKALAYFR